MMAGYKCALPSVWPGAWDVIEIGSTDVILCPSKNEWPSADMKVLRLFRARVNG
jgi:hypothetical protein